MSTNAHAFTGDKVPKLTKILFPWSGIFRDACYALIGTFLVQYAMTSGVLDGADFTAQYGVITTAMFIALIWDGFNDPIMGFILEKVHFKAGKFRPWIALGAIGNGLVVMAMFLCPMLFSGLRGWGYVAFMIVMYILWDTCFTMNDIGYWSMLPALTNDPKERATLTTHTAIAASVGTFLMNIIMFLAVGRGVSTMQVYAFAGLAVAGLFLISQLVVFFLCKEKERDAKQEEVSEQSSILDLFRVVIKNKELRVAAISMFLYYFASFILTGIGLNYFYMVYGYGGGKGGMVATMISVFYVLGTVVSQAFYPMLAKKLKKQTILLISTIVVLISYVAFFFIAFPVFGDNPIAYADAGDGSNMFWVFGGSMSLLYVLCFLFFGASGIFYLTLLVMFQDAIDYGEWKIGERKESICFAWRPLDVKLASGFNRLLQLLVFVITGTSAAIEGISNAESKYYADLAAGEVNAEVATATRDASVAAAMDNIERWQLILFGVIVIGTIIVLFLVAYLLMRFFYHIDEEMEANIVKELEERHQAIMKETAAAEAERPVEAPSQS